MRRKLSLGIVVAIVLCALIAGVALAAAVNDWDLLEFLKNARGYESLPSAAELVVVPVYTDSNGPYANCVIREAIYDGQYIHLLVDVTPKENVFLMDWNWDLDTPMNETLPKFKEETQTIREYARDNTMRVIAIILSVNGTDSGNYVAFRETHEDGQQTYVLMAPIQSMSDEMRFRLECFQAFLYPSYQRNEQGNRYYGKSTTIKFTLAGVPNLGPKYNITPVEYEEVGLRVDKVTLTGSPIAVRCMIEFSVSDREKWMTTGEYEYPIANFVLLDEEGRIVSELYGTGLVPVEERVYSTDHQWYKSNEFIQYITLNPTEELPDHIILAPGYSSSAYEAALYEAKTIPLTSNE